MGCTNDRVISSNFIENPLVTSLDQMLNNQQLNSKFKEAELLLKEMERIRSLTIDHKNGLLYLSGACCKLNPTFLTVIESQILLLATESKGNVYSKQLYFNEGEEPYFSIANSSDSNMKMASEINEYIKTALSFQSTFHKLKQSCEEILKDFNDNYVSYRNDIIKSQSSAEPTIAKSLSVLEKNVQLINQLKRDNCLIEVIKSLEQDLTDIKMIAELINDEAYIKKINSQGIQSEKYNNNQFKIVYNSLEQQFRYGESPSVGEMIYKDKAAFYQDHHL